MKPFCAVVFVVFALPRLGAAGGSALPATLPSAESDWLPHHILSGPAHALGAPFHALGRLVRRGSKPAKSAPVTTPAASTGPAEGTEPTASTKPGAAVEATAPAAEPVESTGLIAFAQVQGRSTPLGLVTSVDLDVGYHLTPHFAAEAGIPAFFVRGPYSLVTNRDWRYFTLLGDPYVDVRYTTTRLGPSLTSILTGTIPFSNSQKIYSTGRAGVDWFNHVEGTLKGVTPFLNFGAANGTVNRYIMPRPYSLSRPYYTLGFISDFEGGASFRIRHAYEIGASAYVLVPAGPQKVFSRFIAPDSPVVGDGNHNRYFTSAFETQGASRIARDNGFSGWIELGRMRHVSVQLGYSRSIHYAFDSLTLVLNFEASPLFRFPKSKE